MIGPVLDYRECMGTGPVDGEDSAGACGFWTSVSSASPAASVPLTGGREAEADHWEIDLQGRAA
ncbi:hypothetical protein Ari01nite_23580 [Paractinoplanes rishiriensis]|uniref:Uncharacterized protein n=2 Tax=Paractinoplanes rishiriensis TaxID=1050105 RepID=A0A919JXF8_9ACTN|nr:hypothetical protein Ari01nite_23580 [Actinoplanes rishiriensis]